MRLEYLRYFVEVALSHSINKAAKNLYISQPALTAAIQSLEKELGFALLNRSPNGVVLTPNGKKIFADACHIIDVIETWDALRIPENHQQNEIHIVANPPIYHNIIPKIIKEIEVDYPFFDFKVTEAKIEEMITEQNLESVNVVLFSRMDNKRNSMIRFMKKNHWTWQILAKDYQFVYMSSENALAKQEYLDIETIRKQNFACYIFSDSDGDFAPIFDKYFYEQNLFYFTNYPAMIKALENNRAVCFFPNLIMKNSDSVKTGTLVGRPLEGLYLPVSHYIAFNNMELLNVEERKVLEIIKNTAMKLLLSSE